MSLHKFRDVQGDVHPWLVVGWELLLSKKSKRILLSSKKLIPDKYLEDFGFFRSVKMNWNWHTLRQKKEVD